MVTVTIDDSKQTGRDIIALLRHHRQVVHFIEETNDEVDIPEGYVSEEVFWNEFDKKLSKAYGKI